MGITKMEQYTINDTIIEYECIGEGIPILEWTDG